MYAKKQSPLVWIIPLLIAAVLIAALVLCLTKFIVVGGSIYPRDAVVLDLRGKELKPERYEKLAGKLPDCKIYWDIPFQGATYSSDTRSLSITSLTMGDVAALSYFEDLETLEAQGCTDYTALLELEHLRPELTIHYGVSLGGKTFSTSERKIALDSIGSEEIAYLANLEELESVVVQGGGSTENFSALQAYCHDKGIDFQVTLGKKTFADDTKEVTAQEITDGELELLPLMTGLKKLHLINPQAEPEAVAGLQKTYPNVKVSLEIKIGGKSIATTETDVDLSDVKIESLEQVEKAMAYLPKVKTVFLGEQDVPHEEMADYRERSRDKYKVVWYIRLGKSAPIRTDVTYFMPGRDGPVFNDDTSFNIRYCEDLIAVDVGHLGVHEVSWVAYLKNLEYLILAHTGVQYIDGIENCKKLKFLELDWSGIRTLDPLKGCTALEDLNIGNTWPDVSALKEMPWLKNIYMIFGSSGDAYELSQALPDTHVVASGNLTVGSGWRKLPNYYAMRDALHAYYMAG